ncbi:MAG: signal recognition particle receptor subunit alpha, partial [Waterburya sp.]
MFNWFRRNEKAEQPPETKPEATKPEITTNAEESAAEVAEPDYLAFAKAAYKNIQERKGEAKQTVEEVKEFKSEGIEESESVNEAETVETDINEPDVAESASKSTEALEEKIEDVEEVSAEAIKEETIAPEIVEPIESETSTPAPNVPAWMQKSQGLAKLKETAIETPVEEVQVPETELDEDFIWSSQVLAKSGRTADNISEEEISWLTKLRQGLGKTRIGLVNQLKAIVGKGPLNEDAVTSIESLLLQADVGIEATDYIIETLQRKLKEEVLPPDQAIAYLKTILQDILDKPLQNQPDGAFVPEKGEFNIWLLTG